MQRYWLRIALGAATIFVLGMGVITLARNSITELRALAASTRPISIPLMIMPFWLDGTQIGTVRRVDILRRAPSDVSGIRLTVQLEDSVPAGRLADCRMTLFEPDGFATGGGFRCVGAADSATEKLKLIGEVAFEPGGAVRALFAPADHADHWRTYDTDKVRVELAKLQAKHLADSALHATIRADSLGALIDIGSKSGKGLVHIQADSHGASLQIRDPSGRKILQMQAHPDGARLSVLADSAPPAR
jgi:hypothetical protein